ncbi:MAG: hypothetical protein ACRELB_14770 [Polyangiaceae bacterium]
MPNTTLHSKLNDLASAFADSVLSAIRTASLDDLVVGARPAPSARRTPGRGDHAGPSEAPKPTNGRLARRGPQDIAKTLGLVVAALKTSPMRAEEIQKLLQLDKRELPRVLKEGLKTKKLRKKGEKRATTYSAR